MTSLVYDMVQGHTLITVILDAGSYDQGSCDGLPFRSCVSLEQIIGQLSRPESIKRWADLEWLEIVQSTSKVGLGNLVDLVCHADWAY